MCLAIAANTQCSNSLFARAWRRMSSTPLRLFSFAALFHLLIGVGILTYSHVSATQINTFVLLFGLAFGVLALLIFGFLMTWLPRNFALSPVHYGRYSSVYLLMMISLLMLEMGSVSSLHWVQPAMWLLVPAWLLALQGLWQLHVWIKSGVEHITRVLFMLFLVNAALLVFGALGYSFDLPMLEMGPYLSIFVVWPITLLVTVFFVIKTPVSGRIVSV